MALYGGAKLAWRQVYPSGTLRYKITVTVQTPEGIKVGSSVWEVYFFCQPKILPDVNPCPAFVAAGDAVIVNLGKRGMLFGLMRDWMGSDYGYHLVQEVFPAPNGAFPLSAANVRYYRSLKTEKVVLRSEQYPDFVYFRYPKDPKTVESVYRAVPYDAYNAKGNYIGRRFHIIDNMEQIFGKGVKIIQVTIQITHEPVTRGIEKILPWIPYYYNKMLDGSRYTSSLSKNHVANGLASGDFKIGERR